MWVDVPSEKSHAYPDSGLNVSAPLFQEKRRNQEDDDCDSVVDEGTCDCQNGQRRECGSSVGRCQPGIQDCQEGRGRPAKAPYFLRTRMFVTRWTMIAMGASMRIPTSPVATQILGACQLGQRLCLDGVLTTCREAVDPTEELCNNIDDDCDGRIDENVTRPCGSAEASANSASKGAVMAVF